jgi:hypothetical protein
MLDLQTRGCPNVNLVTPSHVVPQILEALDRAAGEGLHIPLVYNSGGYDALPTLRWLDGVVDLYLPDLKFADPRVGEELAGARNYPKVAKAAFTEMHRQVGDENIFLFGLTADEVKAAKQQGYKPYEYYTRSPDLKRALDQLSAGFVDGVSYADLAKRLLFGAPGTADEYMLLADFDSYRRAQALAGETYLTRQRWNQMALINIARSGVFAADRSIREYARNIWDVPTRG